MANAVLNVTDAKESDTENNHEEEEEELMWKSCQAATLAKNWLNLAILTSNLALYLFLSKNK